MDLDDIKKAIKSLDGFEGNIGLMGGEPTMHPDFLSILMLYQEMIPRHRRQLWTSGYKWEEYEKSINIVFSKDNISYNDHSKKIKGWHQPLLVAIEEVVDEPVLRHKFIDNCWVQNRWSASITPSGAYFCEVAAAHAELFIGYSAGFEVKPGWWKGKEICDAQCWICNRCSGCLPLPWIMTDRAGEDLVSPGNHDVLKNISDKDMVIANIDLCKAYIEGKTAIPGDEPGSLRDFPEWKPWNYRNEIFHGPRK
jgi:hypothetical protein